MSLSTERDEIRTLVEAMARMLEGERAVSGWRTFLLTLADVLGDPEIEDRDALTESHVQVRQFYRGAPRPFSDFVINRPDKTETRVANEEFLALRSAIDVRLARAADALRAAEESAPAKNLSPTHEN